jgi:hypothetical protein
LEFQRKEYEEVAEYTDRKLLISEKTLPTLSRLGYLDVRTEHPFLFQEWMIKGYLGMTPINSDIDTQKRFVSYMMAYGISVTLADDCVDEKSAIDTVLGSEYSTRFIKQASKSIENLEFKNSFDEFSNIFFEGMEFFWNGFNLETEDLPNEDLFKKQMREYLNQFSEQIKEAHEMAMQVKEDPSRFTQYEELKELIHHGMTIKVLGILILVMFFKEEISQWKELPEELDLFLWESQLVGHYHNAIFTLKRELNTGDVNNPIILDGLENGTIEIGFENNPERSLSLLKEIINEYEDITEGYPVGDYGTTLPDEFIESITLGVKNLGILYQISSKGI